MDNVKKLWDWTFPSLVAAGGTIAGYMGGWDKELQILMLLMVFDYLTGIAAAVKSGKGLSSDVMFWGGIRKAGIMIVIAISVMLDHLLGNGTPVVRMLAVYFYIGREALSVIENLEIFGVWMPSWLKGVLAQVRDRGDKDGGEKKL
jgi:toxin secretion/phage lysis holin